MLEGSVRPANGSCASDSTPAADKTRKPAPRGAQQGGLADAGVAEEDEALTFADRPADHLRQCPHLGVSRPR